jgi:hypothetical protein
MFVQFTRQSGELVSINPQFVAAFTASEDHSDCCIIKMPDGRGYLVMGTYPVVDAMLHGRPVPEQPAQAHGNGGDVEEEETGDED